jgi:TldD protein
MLARPQRFFEERFGLSEAVIHRLLGATMGRRVDHADLYLEYRVDEELVLEEGAVKKASRHVSQGAGVRVQSGERTGYAHTDEVTLPNLEEAARQARAIARHATVSAVVPVGAAGQPHDLYSLTETPLGTDIRRKLDLLTAVDQAARAADPRVRQVIASLASEDLVVLIATPTGLVAGDVRPLTRLSVTVIAEENGKREIGGFGGGGRVGFDFFAEGERWRRRPPPWCSARAGRASCSTRPWDMVSRGTSIGRGRRPSPAGSGSAWPPSW